MITLKVNASGLSEKLRRIAGMTKEDLGKLMRQEGRLLAVELVKYTQPFGMGEDAKRRGEGAVSRDYGRVYPDVESEFMADQIRAKARPNDKEAAKQRWLGYAKGGDEEAMRDMLQDMKLGATTYGVKADPSFHRSRWSRGELKSGPSQIVINRKSVEALKKQAFKMVGFAKRGWSACAKSLGGTRGIPGWISRGRGVGRVIDKTHQGNPSLTLINESKYTTQVLSQSNQNSAIKDREVKLTERLNRIIKSGRYK